MKTHAYHPLCLRLPQYSAEQQQQLNASIKVDGLQQPIVLWEDKILDGRHRHIACVATGTEPRFITFQGGFQEAVNLIIREHLIGRDMTQSQKALLAAELQADLKEHVPDATIAATFNVGERSVRQAKAVLERADDKTIAAVKEGTISVKAAEAALPAKPKPKLKKKQPGTGAGNAKYDAALERIGKIIGPKVRDAVTDGTLRNVSESEAVFWAGLDDDEMAQLEDLCVVKRWTPRAAWRFLDRMPDAKTRLGELSDMAVAYGGAALVQLGAFAVVCFNTKLHASELAKIKKALRID